MKQAYGISMSITAGRLEVLDVLRMNREEHYRILMEAREGYLKEAKRKLQIEMDRLETASCANPPTVSIGLRPPEDHTGEYDTVIKMLEYHKDDHITLTADEVRQLIENRWDWMDRFLEANAAYSNLARSKFNG